MISAHFFSPILFVPLSSKALSKAAGLAFAICAKVLTPALYKASSRAARIPESRCKLSGSTSAGAGTIAPSFRAFLSFFPLPKIFENLLGSSFGFSSGLDLGGSFDT